MNANFFALGQAQVAEAITEKPNLYQGANAGAMKNAFALACDLGVRSDSSPDRAVPAKRPT